MGISIHALLAESDKSTQNDRQRCIISIHALLAESDTAQPAGIRGDLHISIHALLAESDAACAVAFKLGQLFLSTLSLRRATNYGVTLAYMVIFLSTLSLRRATAVSLFQLTTAKRFLSTLSLRRATEYKRRYAEDMRISIHALLAESDRHLEPYGH